MTHPICVLVTGVSGGSIGEQVCKALRLGRHKYKIIATNVSRAPMAVVEADHYATLPPASSKDYQEELLRLVKQFGVQFIIPGSEPELVVLSRHQKMFTNAGVRLLINSPAVIATCVDKLKTFETLTLLGFRVPATLAVNDLTELDSLMGDPPWVVKPVRGGGSTLVFIAQDMDELRFFVRYLLKYGHRPLVQEYVGSLEQEYTVGVLHSPAGDLIGTVVLHRQILSGLSNRLRLPNRTGRAELGPVLAISSGISQGCIVDCAPVRAKAEAIAQALGSVGPLNIQGRWDGKTFVPFEINPRFSGTTPMRAMAGFNEPELLIDWHLNPDHSLGYQPEVKYGEFSRGLVEYFVPGPGELQDATFKIRP